MDPGLSGQVLRVVNSAFYRGEVKVSSVEAAVMRLGFNTMKRIVLMSSLIVDRQVGGGEPAAFHRTNVALHGVNTAVVWLLLAAFGASALAASLGALLFGAHPIQAQAVALLLGRNDLLLLAPV